MTGAADGAPRRAAGGGPTIGILGAGRLGTALAWACERAGLPVLAVASRSRASAEALAAPLRACAVLPADALPGRCDVVFVTTRDADIAAVTAAVRWRAGDAVVHCSGATGIDALASALRDGAAIGGFHPLQSFGDPAAAVASLPGCTIAIEAAEPLSDRLEAIAARLGCRTIRLPPGVRGRYHAAAGYASQFVNALLAEAVEVWRSWGATEDEAVRALLPLVRGTLAGIEAAGVARGMPGPVSRGDVGSVETHVAALAPLGDEALAFYRTLAASTVRIAERSGRIDAAVAASLRRVLGTTPGGDPITAAVPAATTRPAAARGD